MAQRGVNKAIIVGNCGQDPEVRYAQSGTAFATLSVATSETWKDKQTGQQQERTEWHRISIVGKLAEIAGEYLRKGSKVYIEGKLQTRKWQAQDGTDRYTTEIVVDGFGGVMQMLDSYGQEQTPQKATQQAPAQQQQKSQNKPYQRPVERYGSAAPNPMANEPAQQQMPNDFDPDSDIPFAPIGLQEGRNFLHMI